MSDKWFVSRQCYWGVEPSAANVVEIAGGGFDYANPDMLSPKYEGEGIEYANPEEAVEAALGIATAWKHDRPDLKINLAVGYTLGFTVPFESLSEKRLREWVKEVKNCKEGSK